MANEMRDRLKNSIETARDDWWEKAGHKQTSKASADYIADCLLDDGWVRPPCKVKDTVYILTSDAPSGIEKSRVKRMTLANLQDGMTIKITVPCVFDDWGKAVWQFYPEDFGKTVFLTKPEAEQKLKKMRGDTNA